MNETLLDLQPVRGWFSGRCDDQPSAAMWFSELLRLSFAFATTAERFNASIGDGDVSHISGVFTTLPAHRDVAEGLRLLRNTRFAFAAHTNSPQATAEAQLENAGVAMHLDRIMSVEMVNRFKPHRSVYEAAAAALKQPLSRIVMVGRPRLRHRRSDSCRL